MPFNPQIPQPTDLISNSQGALLANNGFLNTSFGTDHYPFDDATANNGKHAVIQMPTQAAIPSTTTDPKFFSYTPAGNAGILQYLKGPSDPVQSPILPLQSSASGINLVNAGGNTAVFDFTGCPYCFGYASAAGVPSTGGITALSAIFAWSGSVGNVTNYFTGPFIFQFSGNVLKLFNNGPVVTMSQVAWTLVFNRIFTPL